MKKLLTIITILLWAVIIFFVACGEETTVNEFPYPVGDDDNDGYIPYRDAGGNDDDDSADDDDDTAGCVNDDECKGDRICKDGKCVNPDKVDDDDDDNGDDDPIIPNGKLGIINGEDKSLIVSGDIFPLSADDIAEIYIAGEFPGNPDKYTCSNAWNVSLCGSYLKRAKQLKSGNIKIFLGGLKSYEMARFYLAAKTKSGKIYYMDVSAFRGDHLIEENSDGDNIRVAHIIVYDYDGSYDGTDMVPCGTKSAYLWMCCAMHTVGSDQSSCHREDIPDCYHSCLEAL